MSEAIRDQNFVTVALGESNTTPGLTLPFKIDEVTGRLLCDVGGGGSGTVTSVSVVSANGLAGTVATATTTPAITLSTTVTGILKGNGTAIAAVTIGSGLTYDGTTLSATGGSSGITIGTTTITSGTDTRILYNNAGVVGEYTLTGSGTVVAMATSPTFATSITGSYLTASEILITDGSKNIVSAPVATYPSLTELTYVKGVTSAIQTQLNAKQATITFGTGVLAALAVNIGSAGAPVLFNGALGTPSSGTVTNLTGTASININGTVGATTPTTGVFTTLVAGSTTSLLLGTAGSAVGNIGFRNATSGTITLAPVAGALGTVTLTLPAITDTIVTLTANQTLTTKTLTSPAITTGTYTGTQLLAEGASIGLDPALSADGTWTGITMTGTSGYSQAFGDLVYLDPTDSRWEAADADVSTAADGDPRGILAMVVVAGTDGNSCTLLLQGVIRADAAFPAMTVNSAMYVGETAGDIQGTIPTGADNVIRVVGQAITADALYFNPSPDWQITVA